MMSDNASAPAPVSHLAQFFDVFSPLVTGHSLAEFDLLSSTPDRTGSYGNMLTQKLEECFYMGTLKSSCWVLGGYNVKQMLIAVPTEGVRVRVLLQVGNQSVCFILFHKFPSWADTLQVPEAQD